MMFLQFTIVMYRNLPFQDRPCLLYDLSVSLLNELRKMFNANYQYLLVIVSGEEGRGVLSGTLWRSCLSPNAITLNHRSIDNKQKLLLKKWQHYPSAN